jgi:hypothetical protein
VIANRLLPAFLLAFSSLASAETLSAGKMAVGESVHKKLFAADISFRTAGDEFKRLGVTGADQDAAVYYLKNTYFWKPLFKDAPSDAKGLLDWNFAANVADDHYQHWFHEKVESKGRRDDPNAVAREEKIEGLESAREYNDGVARRRSQQLYNGMITIVIVILLACSPFAYFFPSFVAWRRKKANFRAIFALNCLAGWTFVGWVVAMVWALTNDAVAPTREYAKGVNS